MTRKIFLILVALMLALSVSLVACPPPEEEEEEEFSFCVDFEDLTLGTQYSVGDTIHTEGVVITVEQFLGQAGDAEVGDEGCAGGSGQEMGWIGNVNLRFDFNGSCDGLSLLFGEYGGGLHIDINDDPWDFEDFHEIDGKVIGGVSVSVVNGSGQGKGSLTLSGTINQNSFVIGGQELCIDHVCLTSPFQRMYTLTIPCPPITMVPPCRVTDPGCGVFIYPAGTVVPIVAEVVAEGFSFVEWVGDVDTVADVNDATTTITMEGNYEINIRCEQTPMPDLVPVAAFPEMVFPYCDRDEQGLYVSVKNQGTATAPSFTTEVEFKWTQPADSETVSVETSALSAGDTRRIGPFPIPSLCWDPDCGFTITIDPDNNVSESSETNNSVDGGCLG